MSVSLVADWRRPPLEGSLSVLVLISATVVISMPEELVGMELRVVNDWNRPFLTIFDQLDMEPKVECDCNLTGS